MIVGIILDYQLPILAELRSAEKSIKPVCDGRNVARRLSGAGVCDRAVAGVRGSRARLWYASGHGSRADVCVFAWMAGKCVS